MTKMAFKWSKNQQQAIDEVGHNLLVSAGAGSGKTAVLTERIFQLVKKGYSISHFLVLTFTNAAAAEMKSRVRDQFLNDSECLDMVSELESSHIETFDAFALYLVKRYASSIGLSNNVSILDASILNIEKNKICDEVFEEYYRASNPQFCQMVSNYCLKNDDNLRGFVQKIMSFADLQIDSETFYQEAIKETYSQESITGLVSRYYQEVLQSLHELALLAETLQDSNDVSAICDLFDNISLSPNYDELVIALQGHEFPNKPRNNGTDDKALRDYIANSYKKIRGHHFGNQKEITKEYLANQDSAQTLLNIAHEVATRFQLFKKEHNAYDFSDIAKMALHILSIPSIKEEVASSFDFVMVDEYQDTSDIQERVIQLLDHNNVYMVGDVKQSIYRFRNANCQIFQDKFQAYKHHNGGEEIDLNQSFRSREEIVNFVNELFEKLMTPEWNMIDYQQGHHFLYQPSIYQDKVDNRESYQPQVYHYEAGKSAENTAKEIAIIADDIIYKINHQYQIYDKELKAMRPVEYRDFAIIMDRGGEFDNYHRYFSAKGIPLCIENDEVINNSTLGFVTKNLIKLFYFTKEKNFGEEYKHAYISIARSFLVSMPDQDLFTIVMNKLYPHTEIQQKIEKLVELYSSTSLHQILSALYRSFNVYDKIITLTRINNCANNIELFLSFAKSMDEIGSSLLDFSTYFDDLDNYQVSVKFSSLRESNNAVTLINIHRSKGLEYPIVYLSGLFKEFNREETKTSWLINSTFGLSLPLVDSANESLVEYFIKEEISGEDFQEKLRLFYVAITRVRERLIFLYPSKVKPSLIIDLKHKINFSSFLEYANVESKYGVDYQFKNTEISEKSPQNTAKKIDFKEISIPSNLIESHRASKELDEDVDHSLLEFGNELHELLEVVDYKNKDLSFIKNPLLARYVNNVLRSSLFKDVKNEMLRHEYAFFDEVHNTRGVIDCLIILDKEIKIVDFKLKNIDDDKYINQLHVYRDYIKTISKLPIRLYLISAMTGEEKEIG